MTPKIKKLEVRDVKTLNRGSAEATSAAEFLFTEIFNNDRKFLKPSFIYALCSVIEETLNGNIIDFFQSKFGKNYKSYAAIFIKMSIHDKMNVLVPLISNYRYTLDHNKKEVKTIKKLFDIRNQLIHIKNHYKTTAIIKTNKNELKLEDMEEKELFIYDILNYSKLDKKTLKEYYSAQKDFALNFFNLFYRMQRKNFKPNNRFYEIIKKDRIVLKK